MLSSLSLHAASFEIYAPLGPLEEGTMSAETYEFGKYCLLFLSQSQHHHPCTLKKAGRLWRRIVSENGGGD